MRMGRAKARHLAAPKLLLKQDQEGLLTSKPN